MDKIEEIELSDQELAFAESYLIVPQKVRAAKEAGYSEASAKQIGYEVYNRPHVKAYIQKRLSQVVMDGDEVLKIVNDMASANLNDYFETREELIIPKVRKGLQACIDQLQYELEIENEYLIAASPDKAEKKSVEDKIKAMERDIIRFEIELNKNPNAYRIVDGDPYLKNVVDLNLHAIAADKERGKIKSFKYTKDGVQVEMYDAQAAADKLLKVHGKYEKDNKRTLSFDFDSEDVIFK